MFELVSQIRIPVSYIYCMFVFHWFEYVDKEMWSRDHWWFSYGFSLVIKIHVSSVVWTGNFHDNQTLPKSPEKCWLEWDLNSHFRHRKIKRNRSVTWRRNVSSFSSAHVRDPPCSQPDNSSQTTRNIMAKNQLGSRKRLYLEKYWDDFRLSLICSRGKVRG